jgi:hypothetical protein
MSRPDRHHGSSNNRRTEQKSAPKRTTTTHEIPLAKSKPAHSRAPDEPMITLADPTAQGNRPRGVFTA